MSYFYTDPTREKDPHALPDAEVFQLDEAESPEDDDGDRLGAGWYVWACLPGCLPDSEPSGPFESAEEAVSEWRSAWGDA